MLTPAKRGDIPVRARLLEALALPPDFWRSDTLLDALAARDVGHLFRLVQKLTGASQTQMGMVTGLSQAQVSEIMSRKRQVSTIEVLARIVEGFGIPDPARTVLFLGSRAYLGDTGRPPASGTGTAGTHAVNRETLAAADADHCDVIAVHTSRSEFASSMPPHTLFEPASSIRAAGLSLNLICQHYSDTELLQVLGQGTTLQCLFLDPHGDAIKAREAEEGYRPGYLSSLTDLNIQNLIRRVRDRLPVERRDSLQIAVYDETVRFNIILVDDDLCIAQPYMPEARGVDSPTLVIRRKWAQAGLYHVFEQVFNSLWERGRPL
jgi:transcriptional regulator with XRE-family HTH domain